MLKGNESCEIISIALLVANEVMTSKLDVLNLMHTIFSKLSIWLKNIENYAVIFSLIATYIHAFMGSNASEI